MVKLCTIENEKRLGYRTLTVFTNKTQDSSLPIEKGRNKNMKF